MPPPITNIRKSSSIDKTMETARQQQQQYLACSPQVSSIHPFLNSSLTIPHPVPTTAPSIPKETIDLTDVEENSKIAKAVSSEPSPQPYAVGPAMTSSEFMSSLMHMLPQSQSSLPRTQTSKAENATSSIFKTVVPGGKWNAKLQMVSYAAYNYCKNIVIEDINVNSVAYGFVLQGDVILEIDSIELFTLTVQQVESLLKERMNEPKVLLIQRFHHNIEIGIPLVLPALVSLLPKSYIQSLFYLEFYDIKSENKCTMSFINSGYYPIGLRCKLCKKSAIHPYSILDMAMIGIKQLLYHLESCHGSCINAKPLKEDASNDVLKHYFLVLAKEIGIVDTAQRGIGFSERGANQRRPVRSPKTSIGELLTRNLSNSDVSSKVKSQEGTNPSSVITKAIAKQQQDSMIAKNAIVTATANTTPSMKTTTTSTTQFMNAINQPQQQNVAVNTAPSTKTTTNPQYTSVINQQQQQTAAVNTYPSTKTTTNPQYTNVINQQQQQPAAVNTAPSTKTTNPQYTNVINQQQQQTAVVNTSPSTKTTTNPQYTNVINQQQQQTAVVNTSPSIKAIANSQYINAINQQQQQYNAQKTTNTTPIKATTASNPQFINTTNQQQHVQKMIRDQTIKKENYISIPTKKAIVSKNLGPVPDPLKALFSERKVAETSQPEKSYQPLQQAVKPVTQQPTPATPQMIQHSPEVAKNITPSNTSVKKHFEPPMNNLMRQQPPKVILNNNAMKPNDSKPVNQTEVRIESTSFPYLPNGKQDNVKPPEVKKPEPTITEAKATVMKPTIESKAATTAPTVNSIPVQAKPSNPIQKTLPVEPPKPQIMFPPYSLVVSKDKPSVAMTENKQEIKTKVNAPPTENSSVSLKLKSLEPVSTSAQPLTVTENVVQTADRMTTVKTKTTKEASNIPPASSEQATREESVSTENSNSLSKTNEPQSKIETKKSIESNKIDVVQVSNVKSTLYYLAQLHGKAIEITKQKNVIPGEKEVIKSKEISAKPDQTTENDKDKKELFESKKITDSYKFDSIQAMEANIDTKSVISSSTEQPSKSKLPSVSNEVNAKQETIRPEKVIQMYSSSNRPSLSMVNRKEIPTQEKDAGQAIDTKSVISSSTEHLSKSKLPSVSNEVNGKQETIRPEKVIQMYSSSNRPSLFMINGKEIPTQEKDAGQAIDTKSVISSTTEQPSKSKLPSVSNEVNPKQETIRLEKVIQMYNSSNRPSLSMVNRKEIPTQGKDAGQAIDTKSVISSTTEQLSSVSNEVNAKQETIRPEKVIQMYGSSNKPSPFMNNRKEIPAQEKDFGQAIDTKSVISSTTEQLDKSKLPSVSNEFNAKQETIRPEKVIQMYSSSNRPLLSMVNRKEIPTQGKYAAQAPNHKHMPSPADDKFNSSDRDVVVPNQVQGSKVSTENQRSEALTPKVNMKMKETHDTIAKNVDDKNSKLAVVKEHGETKELKLTSNELATEPNKEKLSAPSVKESKPVQSFVSNDENVTRPEKKLKKHSLHVDNGTVGTESYTSSSSSNKKTKHKKTEDESNGGSSDMSRKRAREPDLKLKEVVVKKSDKLGNSNSGVKKAKRKKRKSRDEDCKLVPKQIMPSSPTTGRPPRKLVNAQDRSSVSGYYYFLLEQVIPCFATDEHGDQNATIGIECQYCSSTEHPFQLFPTSPRRLRSSCIHSMHEHLENKCKYAPSEVCPKLKRLKNEEMSKYSKIKPSETNNFFQRVWTRLHKIKSVGNLNDERSFTEESIASGDNESNSTTVSDFKSTKIVQTDDQKDISEYQYFLLQQVHTCISGRRDTMSGIDSSPSIGIECIYCSLAESESAGTEKFQLYPTSARRLRTSLSFVYDHLLNCRHVSDDVKQNLVYLRGEETRNYTKIKPSQLDNFFETLWKRLDSFQYKNDVKNISSLEIPAKPLPSPSLKRSVFTPQRDVEI